MASLYDSLRSAAREKAEALARLKTATDPADVAKARADVLTTSRRVMGIQYDIDARQKAAEAEYFSKGN